MNLRSPSSRGWGGGCAKPKSFVHISQTTHDIKKFWSIGWTVHLHLNPLLIHPLLYSLNLILSYEGSWTFCGVFLAGILLAVVVLLFGMKAKDNVEEILMYTNRNYDENDIRWEWGYIMSEYHTFVPVIIYLGWHLGIRTKIKIYFSWNNEKEYNLMQTGNRGCVSEGDVELKWFVNRFSDCRSSDDPVVGHVRHPLRTQRVGPVIRLHTVRNLLDYIKSIVILRTIMAIWFYSVAKGPFTPVIYKALIITGRNEVVAKVIFLHLSVIHSVHGGRGSASVHAGIPPPLPGTTYPPWTTSPPDYVPPQTTYPPGLHTPRTTYPPGLRTPPL